MIVWRAATRLDLDVMPSQWLGLIAVLVHGVACAGLVATGLPILVKGLLMAAATASLAATLWRFVFLRAPQSIVGLMSPPAGDAEWRLARSDGRQIGGWIHGRVLVTELLIGLSFRGSDGRSYPVALFADSLGANRHREARVALMALAFDPQP